LKEITPRKIKIPIESMGVNYFSPNDRFVPLAVNTHPSGITHSLKYLETFLKFQAHDGSVLFASSEVVVLK